MTITYFQHKISRHKRLRMRQPGRVASVKYEGGYFTGGGGGGEGRGHEVWAKGGGG